VENFNTKRQIWGIHQWALTWSSCSL